MTNEEVMSLLTEMGQHEGGMENWVMDNAWVAFANRVSALVRADEREVILKISATTWFKTQADYDSAIRARAEPEQKPVKRTVMYRPADLEALGLTHEDVVKLIKDQS